VQRRLWIAFVDKIGNFDEILCRARREASSIEAAKSSFYLRITGEFAAFSLPKTFQHRRQMQGVDFLRFAVGRYKPQHRTRESRLGFRAANASRLRALVQEVWS
jgi:hypothetical protein